MRRCLGGERGVEGGGDYVCRAFKDSFRRFLSFLCIYMDICAVFLFSFRFFSYISDTGFSDISWALVVDSIISRRDLDALKLYSAYA